MALATMQPEVRWYKLFQQSTTFIISFPTGFTDHFIMKVILLQHLVTSDDFKPIQYSLTLNISNIAISKGTVKVNSFMSNFSIKHTSTLKGPSACLFYKELQHWTIFH